MIAYHFIKGFSLYWTEKGIIFLAFNDSVKSWVETNMSGHVSLDEHSDFLLWNKNLIVGTDLDIEQLQYIILRVFFWKVDVYSECSLVNCVG